MLCRQCRLPARRAVGHFDTLSDGRRKAAIRDRALEAAVSSMNGSTLMVTTGAILIAAAEMMRSGSFTVGDFALFVAYVGGSRCESIRSWLGSLVVSLKQNQVYLERVGELVPGESKSWLVLRRKLYLSGPFPQVPQVVRPEADRLEMLSLRGLTYRYPRTGRGVEGVSLDLPRGSFTVVTGRIGSGKATLLGSSSACCQSTPARLPGTAVPWTIPGPSWYPHDALTLRRCLVCTATHSATTSLWEYTRNRPTSMRRYGWP